MRLTDVHQHLWSEALIAHLARRRRPPLVRRSGMGWKLRLPGEPDYHFDPDDHDPEARRRLLERDGMERALVCLSSPLGIESLPADEAQPLLDAHNAGIRELGDAFGVWGAVSLRPPDGAAVDALLDAGAIGVSLPAGALAGRDGLARCARVLERLDHRGAPLLVHPGPAPWGPQAYGGYDAPSWWPALTQYVADMNAAWHAFATWGRPRHPRLRVVFAMLAGGAPLHLERLAARGGPIEAASDPLLFYDVSSYGVRAVDACVRCVGIDQLVYGSDRPVIDPPSPSVLGAAAGEAMLGRNVARLLRGGPVEVAA